MGNKIVPIVEGPGDVEAVPMLLRSYLSVLERFDVEVARPKNANGCGNLTKKNGVEKFVRYALLEPNCGGILLLIDADVSDGCPVEIAKDMRKRIGTIGVTRSVAIVVATQEYEAWIVASIESVLASRHCSAESILKAATLSVDPEGIKNPKKWLELNVPGLSGYKETIHQPSMTAAIDIQQASKRSRSFKRMLSATDWLIERIDSGRVDISPGA